MTSSSELSTQNTRYSHKQTNLILIAAMMGVILVSIDVSVVNVALEALQRSFATKMSGLQWILNIYTLAYAVFLLSAGALCDRKGARSVFLLGLITFTLASLGCGLSPSFSVLLGSRAIQGISAAMLVPSAIALLQQAYADPKRRAQAVGLWAGAGSLALAGGPILGGALIEHFGWRSIFLINLPIGLIGTCLAFRFAPSSPVMAKRDIDIGGQVLAAMALACFTGALTQAGGRGWADPWIGGGLLVGVVLFAFFLTIERTTKHPMMPLSLFRSRAFSAAIAVGAVVNFAFYGLVFVFSLFFQTVQGKSAFETGLSFVPMTAVIMLVNVMAGRLIGSRGSRPIMLAGLVVAAAGYGGMLTINAEASSATIVPIFLIAGAGIALIVPAVMTTAITASSIGQAGIGAGVLNSARQVGGAIGVAVFGSILGAFGPAGFITGMHVSIALAAAAFVASATVASLFIR